MTQPPPASSPCEPGGVGRGGGRWTLGGFNAEPDDTADDALRGGLRACCAAPSWIDGMIAGRPYADLDAVHARSDELSSSLDGPDLDAALAGHPRIGERSDSAWSRQEQAGANHADARLRGELREVNAAYEQRFGHVYLVCATGRSAAELLAIARDRLGNDPAVEQDVVRRELAAINRIRLDKLLGGAR